jgi:hypothetical protein
MPTAAASLLATLRSSHASSHAAAGHPYSGHTTKLVDNDARPNNIEHACPKVDTTNDIHKVLDNWKKFDEFFNRCKNSPPIVDPPQQELTTPKIAHEGGAPPPTTMPSLQLTQLIADPNLSLGEICTMPISTSAMLTPRSLTTPTSIVATDTFGYINDLRYASCQTEGTQ